MPDDIFPTDQLTDVSSPQEFWGGGGQSQTDNNGYQDAPQEWSGYSNPGNTTTQIGDNAPGIKPNTFASQSFAGAEDPSNHDKMTQPDESLGHTVLTGVKAGLKSLGSPAARNAVNENAALYRYYGDKATAAYQPTKMGVSSPAAAGQVGAIKSSDPNSLNAYWMSKLRQFSVPGWQGK